MANTGERATTTKTYRTTSLQIVLNVRIFSGKTQIILFAHILSSFDFQIFVFDCCCSFHLDSYSICQASVDHIKCAQRMQNSDRSFKFSSFVCVCFHHLFLNLKTNPPSSCYLHLDLLLFFAFFLSLLWAVFLLLLFLLHFYYWQLPFCCWCVVFEGKNSIRSAFQTKFDGTTEILLLLLWLEPLELITVMGGRGTEKRKGRKVLYWVWSIWNDF